MLFNYLFHPHPAQICMRSLIKIKNQLANGQIYFEEEYAEMYNNDMETLLTLV